MFKKIINHKGFWRSVFSIGTAFALLFIVFKWILEGFSFQFITERDPKVFLFSIIIGGFAYGFFVTYGKFWKKLKERER